MSWLSLNCAPPGYVTPSENVPLVIILVSRCQTIIVFSFLSSWGTRGYWKSCRNCKITHSKNVGSASHIQHKLEKFQYGVVLVRYPCDLLRAWHFENSYCNEH